MRVFSAPVLAGFLCSAVVVAVGCASRSDDAPALRSVANEADDGGDVYICCVDDSGNNWNWVLDESCSPGSHRSPYDAACRCGYVAPQVSATATAFAGASATATASPTATIGPPPPSGTATAFAGASATATATSADPCATPPLTGVAEAYAGRRIGP